MIAKQALARKAKQLKFILLDVDGVMTDAGIYYTAEGVEMKRFNAHDGYGIARARDLGIKFGIISGRDTPVVTRRAKDLKIVELHQGRIDKVTVFRDIQKRHKLAENEFCFIGDDVFDLPLLELVGLSIAPANAIAEVKKRVDYVCKAKGGDGAVREAVDMILSFQNK